MVSEGCSTGMFRRNGIKERLSCGIAHSITSLEDTAIDEIALKMIYRYRETNPAIYTQYPQSRPDTNDNGVVWM
jgi:hypothetical protein